MGPDGQQVLQAPYAEEAVILIDIHPKKRPARGNTWSFS